MNLITSILSLLWVLLVGTQPRANDLRRQPTKQDLKEDLRSKINEVIIRNRGIIAVTIVVVALAAFMFICYTLVGTSAVESGITYNHFQEVI